jgi:hypothetical protein
MFTFGPAFEAEMEYRAAGRAEAARRARGRRDRVRSGTPRPLLGLSPLGDLVSLLRRWTQPDTRRRPADTLLAPARSRTRW